MTRRHLVILRSWGYNMPVTMLVGVSILQTVLQPHFSFLKQKMKQYIILWSLFTKGKKNSILKINPCTYTSFIHLSVWVTASKTIGPRPKSVFCVLIDGRACQKKDHPWQPCLWPPGLCLFQWGKWQTSLADILAWLCHRLSKQQAIQASPLHREGRLGSYCFSLVTLVALFDILGMGTLVKSLCGQEM